MSMLCYAFDTLLQQTLKPANANYKVSRREHVSEDVFIIWRHNGKIEHEGQIDWWMCCSGKHFLLKTILGIWRKEIRNNWFIEDGKRTSLVSVCETKVKSRKIIYFIRFKHKLWTFPSTRLLKIKVKTKIMKITWNHHSSHPSHPST